MIYIRVSVHFKKEKGGKIARVKLRAHWQIPCDKKTGVEVPDRVTSTEVPPIPDSQVSASTKPHNQSSALRDMTNSLQINLPLSRIAAALCRVIREKGFRLSIAPTRIRTVVEQRSKVKLAKKKGSKH